MLVGGCVYCGEARLPQAVTCSRCAPLLEQDASLAAMTTKLVYSGRVLADASALGDAGVSECAPRWRSTLTGEELIGANIVAAALTAPLMRIAENAGVNGAVVAENVKAKSFNEGYNAANGEYVDMLAAGIVDPAKVTRSGLQNAASIAGMVLTTECIVADLPEKKEAAPAGGGMGGGDFDY